MEMEMRWRWMETSFGVASNSLTDGEGASVGIVLEGGVTGNDQGRWGDAFSCFRNTRSINDTCS